MTTSDADTGDPSSLPDPLPAPPPGGPVLDDFGWPAEDTTGGLPSHRRRLAALISAVCGIVSVGFGVAHLASYSSGRKTAGYVMALGFTSAGLSMLLALVPVIKDLNATGKLGRTSRIGGTASMLGFIGFLLITAGSGVSGN